MSAMKQAMENAGIKPVDERLHDAAVTAIEHSEQNFAKAKKEFRNKLLGSPDLVEALFKKEFDSRLADYLRDVAGEGGCQLTPSRRDARPPSPPTQIHRMAALSVVSRAHPSPLKWKTELGVVNDLSKEQLTALSNRRIKEAKVYEALAHGMPPGGLVKDCWSESAAEMMMVRLSKQRDHNKED